MSTVAAFHEPLGWMPPPEEIYRIDVEEYERLAELGILHDSRVELLDGVLVRKMTKKPEHSTKAERLRRLLERILPTGLHLRKEEPVRLPDYNEPEPDLRRFEATSTTTRSVIQARPMFCSSLKSRPRASASIAG